MNTALRITWLLIIASAIVSYGLPLAWWWRLGSFLCLFLLIVYGPLIKILIMEVGVGEVDEEDIILALRINKWQTVEEIRKSIRRNQGIKRVSLLQVMSIAYKLADKGTIEGRKRRPPQPSFFGTGNMWEYHQKSVI